MMIRAATAAKTIVANPLCSSSFSAGKTVYVGSVKHLLGLFSPCRSRKNSCRLEVRKRPGNLEQAAP